MSSVALQTIFVPSCTSPSKRAIRSSLSTSSSNHIERCRDIADSGRPQSFICCNSNAGFELLLLINVCEVRSNCHSKSFSLPISEYHLAHLEQQVKNQKHVQVGVRVTWSCTSISMHRCLHCPGAVIMCPFFVLAANSMCGDNEVTECFVT